MGSAVVHFVRCRKSATLNRWHGARHGRGEWMQETNVSQVNEDEYQRKRREALELIEKLRAQGIECELAEDLTLVRKHQAN